MEHLSAGVSRQGVDAIGYMGGALLAGCFLPQIYQVIATRSVHDISIAWSLLYTSGLTLTTVYLMFKDAPAAWIPSLFELVGGLLVLLLKLFFEHTAVGRKMCAAKQLAEQLAEQQLQPEGDSKVQEVHSEDGDKPDKVPVTPRTHMRNTLSAYGSGRFASIYNQAFSLPTTPRGSHCGASVASQRSLGPGAHTASGQRRSVELHVSTAGFSEDAAGIVLQVSDSASSKAGQLQQAELPGSPKCVLRLPTHRLRASAAGQLATAAASPAAALHHEAVSTEPGAKSVSWQGSFGDHSSQHTCQHSHHSEAASEAQPAGARTAAPTPRASRPARLMWSSSMSDPGQRKLAQS